MTDPHFHDSTVGSDIDQHFQTKQSFKSSKSQNISGSAERNYLWLVADAFVRVCIWAQAGIWYAYVVKQLL